MGCLSVRTAIGEYRGGAHALRRRKRELHLPGHCAPRPDSAPFPVHAAHGPMAPWHPPVGCALHHQKGSLLPPTCPLASESQPRDAFCHAAPHVLRTGIESLKTAVRPCSCTGFDVFMHFFNVLRLRAVSTSVVAFPCACKCRCIVLHTPFCTPLTLQTEWPEGVLYHSSIPKPLYTIALHHHSTPLLCTITTNFLVWGGGPYPPL